MRPAYTAPSSISPGGPPETKFVYSDIDFILLGEIVKRLSGMPENEYAKQILFDPLGMKDTGYLPDPALRPRIAPTEMLPPECPTPVPFCAA